MLEDTEKYPTLRGLNLSCLASELVDAVSDLLWFSASLHLCDKMNKMNLKSVSQETIYLTGKKNSVMDKLISKNFRPGPVRTSFLQASTMYLLYEQAVRT